MDTVASKFNSEAFVHRITALGTQADINMSNPRFTWGVTYDFHIDQRLTPNVASIHSKLEWLCYFNHWHNFIEQSAQ